MNDADLQIPQLYFNRELSFLEFNQRVLEQAKDPSIPILERVRFLCISCAILDEFFEIRVASLKELLEAGAVQPGPDGLSVPEQLKAIRLNAVRLVDEQYEVLNDMLMPELAKSGVVFLEPETWTPAQAKWIADYFTREVEPVLSPLALDPARPFPKILNKSLNFAIVVQGEDGFGRNSGLAVVQAPRRGAAGAAGRAPGAGPAVCSDRIARSLSTSGSVSGICRVATPSCLVCG